MLYRLLVTLPLAGLCMATPAGAYLRLHPDNPRYFLETRTGEAVVIASYGNLVPTRKGFDNEAELRAMRAHGARYARVWHFLPWEGDLAVWPWRRGDVPGAYMGGHGGNRFDMERWNPDYWARMRRTLAAADAAGIYAEILLFDRCGMSPGGDRRWAANPWASDNNANGLETPPSSADGVPEFYQFASRPRLRRQQERYVRKMIAETASLPNVIYEVENEHTGDASPEFGRHYARFVKAVLAERDPREPRLVSYSSIGPDLEAFYAVRAVDVVNRHFGGEAERDPDALNAYLEPRWRLGKAINVDEFANGVRSNDLLRAMCWTILTSGGNFHVEDAAPSARPLDVVRGIARFLRESRWRFVRSAPDRSLVASGGGYCMARPGEEYVAYFPRGGEVALRLRAGRRYRAAWWDPRAGRFAASSVVNAGDEPTPLRTPDARDWTLHVTALPAR